MRLQEETPSGRKPSVRLPRFLHLNLKISNAASICFISGYSFRVRVNIGKSTTVTPFSAYCTAAFESKLECILQQDTPQARQASFLHICTPLALLATIKQPQFEMKIKGTDSRCN